MKRQLFLLFNFLLFITAVKAAPVDEASARSKAQRFVTSRYAAARGTATSTPNLRLENTTNGAFYIFNNPNGGFVIVSADDRTPEILGYSDEGQFDSDNVPDNMRAWLQSYADQIKAMPETAEARQMSMQRKVAKNNIAPLIETHWNQARPYYNNCPAIGSTRCVTGCVATAMAQLMYYHQCTTNTTAEIPAYQCNTIWNSEIRFSFEAIPNNTLINWGAMWTSYPYRASTVQESELSEEEQKANSAVAQLMQYCGQSVKMEYRPSGNGGSSATAEDAARALVDYFGFDARTKHVYRSSYSSADWDELIYEELAASRPVIYGGSSSGGGHEFIVDGYEDGYYHVNWGWGGDLDCNVLLSVMNPYNNSGIGASSSKDGYSINQGAIIYAQKDQGLPPVENPIVMTTDGINCTTTYTSRGENGNFIVNIEMAAFNYTDETHNFDIGFGVYNSNGELLYSYTYGTLNSVGHLYGSNNISGNLQFGKDWIDGTYKIYGISKQNGSEEWHRNEKTQNHIIAIIDGQQMRLLSPTSNLTASNMQVEGDFIVGHKQHLKATIQNNGTDFNNYIYLVVDGTCKGGKIFEVALGASGNFDIEYIPAASGTYTFRLALDKNGTNVIGTLENVIISEEDFPEGNDNVNLTFTTSLNSTTIGSTKYFLGNKLKATITAINNTENNYNGYCVLMLYKWIDNHADGSVNYQILNVPANSSSVLNFEYDLDMSGKYSVCIKYLHNGNYISNDDTTYDFYFVTPAIKVIDTNGTETLQLAEATFTVPANAQIVDLRNQTTITSVNKNANPNCLYLLDSTAETPFGLGTANVIKGTIAKQITLTDGYDFVAPFNFTAETITYTRIFDKGGSEENGGWSTLVLPFDVVSVEAESSTGIKAIDWFHSSDDTKKNFWLKQLTNDDEGVITFSHVSDLKANIPYIIAVPDDTWGEKWNLRNTPITFIGKENSIIHQNASATTCGSNYQFIGTMHKMTLENVYTMDAAGEDFILGETEVGPFRAYFYAWEPVYAAEQLNIRSLNTFVTPVSYVTVTSTTEKTGIFSLDGRKMGNRLQDLPKGIYIMNGKKIMK